MTIHQGFMLMQSNCLINYTCVLKNYYKKLSATHVLYDFGLTDPNFVVFVFFLFLKNSHLSEEKKNCTVNVTI